MACGWLGEGTTLPPPPAFDDHVPARPPRARAAKLGYASARTATATLPPQSSAPPLPLPALHRTAPQWSRTQLLTNTLPSPDTISDKTTRRRKAAYPPLQAGGEHRGGKQNGCTRFRTQFLRAALLPLQLLLRTSLLRHLLLVSAALLLLRQPCTPHLGANNTRPIPRHNQSLVGEDRKSGRL
jgi:hypothetical protein